MNKTTTKTIGNVNYIFHSEIGWYDQASYDPANHMVMQFPIRDLERSQRLADRMQDESRTTALLNPAEQRLARLRAWVISWDGVPKPNEQDYIQIRPSHMDAIEQVINTLEEAMVQLEIDDPLEKSSTDLSSN